MKNSMEWDGMNKYECKSQNLFVAVAEFLN